MALQQKYSELIKSAQTGGASNLQVREQNNVLYIDGQVSSEAEKQKLVIEKIDVGGPSMIRAAAKNFKDVLVVSAKKEYAALEALLIQQNWSPIRGKRAPQQD